MKALHKQLIISLRILQLELELDHLKRLKDHQSSHILQKEIDDIASEIVITIRTRRGTPTSIQFLVKGYPWRKLKITIDGSKNHKRPHLHVDIDGKFHVASISINDAELLAGELPNGFSRIINSWIKLNKELLNKIWVEVEKGNKPDGLKSTLTEIDL